MGDFVLEVEEHNFKGPIELLYELIEKRKLLVHDISLAKVADDFIAFIEKQTNFPLGEVAQFLSIASTLLLIKSKSLLPGLVLTGEEEADAKELEKRLALYAKVRELEGYIKERFGKSQEFFPIQKKDDRIVFAPSKNISIENLHKTFVNVVNLIPKLEKREKASIAKVISLEQMIVSLGDRLTKAINSSFGSLTKDYGGKMQGHKYQIPKEEKKNLIVTFLALLELVKRGVVEAMQESHSTDILLESKSISTPTYG